MNDLAAHDLSHARYKWDTYACRKCQFRGETEAAMNCCELLWTENEPRQYQSLRHKNG
jgi:hypothetical protein